MDPDLDAAPIPGQGENLAELIFNEQITDKRQTTEVQDTEQKAPADELGSVLLSSEEIDSSSKREFAKNLYKSFRFCQTFMTFLGRFPIISYENEDHSIMFEYNWNSCLGSMFFITFAIIVLLTVLSSVSIISTMLDFPKMPFPLPDESSTVTWDIKVDPNGKAVWESILPQVTIYPKWAEILNSSTELQKSPKLLRAEEMFIFRRNLASLLIVLFLMYHVLLADFNLYNRRHLIANYLTIWTESVEIMKIDPAGDARKFTKKFILCYMLWFFAFLVVVCLNFAPVASGAPVSFAFLWIRWAYPPIHSSSDLAIIILRGLGGFVYMYVVLCSKVYVLFFLYICKILTTACTVWNERLEKVFTQEERKKQRKDKCATRTGFDHLFKDYVTLLELRRGADTIFANIIESYFSMTLISIVFEVYYFTRPLSENQTEFSDARSLDMIPLGIFLFNSLMVFYLVSTGAAEVGEASANGLEIIRRQGIMGHRSDSEMQFMISLYMSYTGHFDTALSGGGYFLLDKTFFVAIAGTMISYIIIIFQFQPNLGLSNRDQQNIIEVENPFKLRTLIMHVENTFYYSEDREPTS